MSKPRALFVDVGGVLLLPNNQRIATTISCFTTNMDPSRIDRAHYAGIAAMGDAPDTDLTAWPAYFEAIARICGVSNDRLRDAALALHEEFTAPPNIWNQVVRESVGALRQLAQAIPIVVLSNSERGDVAERLVALEVCQQGPGRMAEVAAIIDSAHIGFAKPDVRIFERAMAVLDVEPGHVVHVGDTPGTDVAGALAAGIEPVLFDPHDDHGSSACRRVRSLLEVEQLLVDSSR